MMISRFAEKLVESLQEEAVPKGIENEMAFERRFVVPVATRIAESESDLWLFTHPWGNKNECTPNCQAAMEGKGKRILGCPKCWKESKQWATVDAFGARHTFDLVGKDRSGSTLAVETKLAKIKGRNMPSGELQRFLGQCALASAKLDCVVGVFGYRGSLNHEHQKDTDTVTKWAEQLGVNLVFRVVE